MRYKRLMALICVFAMVTNLVQFDNRDDVYGEEYGVTDDVFMSVDEDGNIVAIDTEDIDASALENALEVTDVVDTSESEEVNEVYDGDGQVVQMTATNTGTTDSDATATSTGITYGVVIFDQTSNKNTYYTNVETGYTNGYTSGAYAPDAAYLGTDGDGNVLFKQAGVYGKVAANKVKVVAYTSTLYTSRYKVNNGKIYHYITTNMKDAVASPIIGYQQSYMKEGATYFSYDGHYFYTDYKVMLNDYMNHTYANSINSAKPYFNYYQSLTHRSKTTFTAEQINEYILAKIEQNKTSLQEYINRYVSGYGFDPYDSKLIGIGQDLIDIQNKYGVNAMLILGVAINESRYGCSKYAFLENNLFGHAVYDSDTSNGYSYDTVYQGIVSHATRFLSYGYLNPWNWKYFGSSLGDKQSGLNVRYASDPYWGEKAASLGYSMKSYFDDKDVATTDLYSYDIGYVSTITATYLKTSTTSYKVYTTASGVKPPNDNVIYSPILLLSNPSDSTWVKIQSDGPLNADRTAQAFTNDTAATYNYGRDYVYIQTANLKVITYYDALASTPDDTTGDTGDTGTTDETEEVVSIVGDVTNSGKIDIGDYMMIRDSLVGAITLTEKQRLAADTNHNDKIDIGDYMMIRDYLVGKLKEIE